MSQAGIINTSSGPVPPTVPTSFVTDSGTAVPAANILNVLGNDSTVNNTNGIFTTGSGNTVTVVISNRITGTATTSDATPTTIASFALGAVATVYTFDIQIASFNVTDVNGDGYFISGSARTDGVTATLCGTPDKIVNEEVADTADANMIVSGNNVIIQATGIAGKTHHWNTVATYIQVT